MPFPRELFSIVNSYIFVSVTFAKNFNQQMVIQKQQNEREKSKAEVEKKRAKDKEDREKQKQKQLDRKDAEKKRTQKGEKRR